MENKIFFFYNNNIEFDPGKNEVCINGKKVTFDSEKYPSSEEYANQHMRHIYREVLSRQYENIVVLTGAGSSVGVGKEKAVGKTMAGLWDEVEKTLGKEALAKYSQNAKCNTESKNLEELLSMASLAATFLPGDEMQHTTDEIKKIIQKNCKLTLTDDAPHSSFIRKLTSRKLKYSRVKLFTLNYDLLFEQAASKGGYVIIDGFSFNTPRLFNGTNFDYDIVTRNSQHSIAEENFFPKVFHLYKVHGSLDWEKQADGTFAKKDEPNNPVMIYPSSQKYEASYEQPYFEMISRFQQELRNRNTLFIVIGFSFGDKHIKAMIDEAINLNPSLTMVVVSPDVKDPNKYLDLKDKTNSMKNILLINANFSDFVASFPYSDIYDYSETGDEDNDTI